MTTEITLWNPQEPVIIPATIREPRDIALYAKQLTKREIYQVVSAFESGSYEMGAMFLWARTMAALKKQLASLGMEFIGELLERGDITEDSAPTQVLTDYESVYLAEELGMFTSIQAMRFRRTLEMMAYFSEPPIEGEDEEEREMMPEEAIQCLRVCIQNVLGHERLEGAIEFSHFRKALEEKHFTEDDPEIKSLLASSYFFKRTALRVLLALAKTEAGAQLEHILANSLLIIPALWRKLLKSDRWLVGRAYTDVHSEGRKSAASGLRKVLLKVHGFDYVPEDLRSRTFIEAAAHLKGVHFDLNNFYNEPVAIKALASLGTTIPVPAISTCVTSILCVRLGNQYGISYRAQQIAKDLLKDLGEVRWKYYLDECLIADEVILGKLIDDNIIERWFEVVEENNLAEIEVKWRVIRDLIQHSVTKQKKPSMRIADRIFNNLIRSKP